jgi:acyl-CoA reductase-like NAD-dependent aldehyde dehydrogenase
MDLRLPDLLPMYLAGQPHLSSNQLAVHNKYSGQLLCRVSMADPESVGRAIEEAVGAAESMRRLPAYRRQQSLRRCADRFEERADELAALLCAEVGKPIRDARVEVERLVDTFRIAAEESVRIGGQVLPMDVHPRGAGYRGMWQRQPVGPVTLITPFNFPLNLVAHKVAPALAAGCTFILKPASRTPVSALIVAEVLAESDLPRGAFSVLPCEHRVAGPLVADPRIRLLSFTGSPAVGWQLRRRAVHCRVTLELGGNAACIVHDDADLELAVERVVVGGYYQSGQSCISVQRVLVHRRVYETFQQRLVQAVENLRCGDPALPTTDIGPLIDASECQRVASWVEAAVAMGARVLCGGRTLSDCIYAATVMEQVPRECDLYRREVFGPVTLLEPYDEFSQAIELANDSAYGLQAGVFTNDIERGLRAWDELQVGGVCWNEVPSFRLDHMPYGGVKASGLGHEGVRWAIEEMTQLKLMIIRQSDHR